MSLKYYPTQTREDLLNELDKVPLKKAKAIVKERHFSRNEHRLLKIYYAQRTIREIIPLVASVGAANARK